MSISFQVALEEKMKKKIVIFQCQCGCIIKNGSAKTLGKHIELHGRSAFRFSSDMEKSLKL